MQGVTMRSLHIRTRRSFLKDSLAGCVGLSTEPLASALRTPDLPSEGIAAGSRSRVVVLRDPMLHRRAPGNVSEELAPNLGRLSRLLDVSVNTLFGVQEPNQAWATVVRPGQKVGIKVNTLGGRGLSSNVLLIEAICERLQQVGVRAQDVVVWDRDTEELRRAGFPIRIGGNQVQCFGTDLVGFEGELVSFGSVGSRLSKILTRLCDVLINVPVLKDHDGAGVSIALKNMYGVIHNPNKYHPNGCDPYVADVNMLPEIRGRLRLHICDATTACYEGGPAFKPEFTWRANSLLVSEDPVSLDTIGWQMIEHKRAQQGLKTLADEGRAPRYIETAADADHRLGIHARNRIDVVEAQMS